MTHRSLAIHPFCLLLPEANGEDRRNLWEDIRKHGVKVPIVLFEGKILDGRSRYQIAQLLGKECPTVDFSGSEKNAIDMVATYNLCRRHLNQSQKAMVAVSLMRAMQNTSDTDGSHLGREDAEQVAVDLTGAARSTMNRAERIMDRTPLVAQRIVDGEETIGRIMGRSRTRCPNCGHQW